ncbi:MAG: nuclear transport factor 2 family protein [Pseudomonadota bacterium]
MNPNIAAWKDVIHNPDAARLNAMLADDVTFHSPVVHTPQEGRKITSLYLMAAGEVFSNGPFHYVREFDLGDRAVLEFPLELDGIEINGVDLIEWNENGEITDFKVMVRPLKGVHKLHEKMGEMLERMKGAA